MGTENAGVGTTEFAIDRARAAKSDGDTTVAIRWLRRANQLTSGHPTTILLLAAALCEEYAAESCKLLQGLVERSPECHDAWVALLAVHVRLNQVESAARVLDTFLRAFRPPPNAAFYRLADEITRRAASPGWCSLSASGELLVSCAPDLSPSDIRIEIDGGIVSGLTFTARPEAWVFGCPPAWRTSYSMSLSHRSLPLLGGEKLLARWRESSGFVEVRHGQGLAGHAWLPADPEAPPVLRLKLERDGAQRSFPVRLAATAEPLPDGTMAWSFVISEKRIFNSENIRVVNEGGHDLWGSPLQPYDERISAEAAVLAVTAALHPNRIAKGPTHRADLWRPLHIIPAILPVARAAHRSTKRRAPACDIIIPVHNGRDDLRRCLESVWRSQPPHGSRIIVVDDGSTDPILRRWLDECAAHGKIMLVRRDGPRGFPSAVNDGLAVALTGADHDVVLLNSDTVVPKAWLTKLAAAAHAAPDIGSVTPLSNDGSIAAAGRVAALGDLSDADVVDALDQLCSEATHQQSIDVPTGVGFCMYIKRSCLDQIGGFRPAVFAQGYGEENDWCMRARVLGWRHVVATDVFVAHSGGRSFGAAKAFLIRRNTEILNRLHPGYAALVEAHGFRDAIRLAWRAIDARRWLALLRDERCVILITHRLGGGVQRFVSDRCADFKRAGVRALLLCPPDRDAEPNAQFNCELQDSSGTLPPLGFTLPDDLEDLSTLLASLRVKSVEIHHLLGHHEAATDLAARLGVPMYVTVHDYGYWCPRFNLVSYGSEYCNEPDDISVCESCVADLGSPIAELTSVASHRDRSSRLLGEAKTVVVSSEDAQHRFSRHFPGIHTVLRRWASDDPLPPKVLRRSRAAQTCHQIVTVGAIGPEKGYNILLACARDAAQHDLPISFNVVGFTTDDRRLLDTGRVFISGRYEESDCQSLLRATDAGLGFLPSVWPETWCFALSALLEAGLDVLSFNIGTQAERILSARRGFVVPLGTSAPAINRAILAYFAGSAA